MGRGGTTGKGERQRGKKEKGKEGRRRKAHEGVGGRRRKAREERQEKEKGLSVVRILFWSRADPWQGRQRR